VKDWQSRSMFSNAPKLFVQNVADFALVNDSDRPLVGVEKTCSRGCLPCNFTNLYSNAATALIWGVYWTCSVLEKQWIGSFLRDILEERCREAIISSFGVFTGLVLF
jgi:hypothetical protein